MTTRIDLPRLCGNCSYWEKNPHASASPEMLMGDCTVSPPMWAEQDYLNNSTHQGRSATDCMCYHERGREVEITAPEIVTKLDRIWITFKRNHSICIHETDEGVVVDMYAHGKEDESNLASCYVFDSEVEDDCKEAE